VPVISGTNGHSLPDKGFHHPQELGNQTLHFAMDRDRVRVDGYL